MRMRQFIFLILFVHIFMLRNFSLRVKCADVSSIQPQCSKRRPVKPTRTQDYKPDKAPDTARM